MNFSSSRSRRWSNRRSRLRAMPLAVALVLALELAVGGQHLGQPVLGQARAARRPQRAQVGRVRDRVRQRRGRRLLDGLREADLACRRRPSPPRRQPLGSRRLRLARPPASPTRRGEYAAPGAVALCVRACAIRLSSDAGPRLADPTRSLRRSPAARTGRRRRQQHAQVHDVGPGGAGDDQVAQRAEEARSSRSRPGRPPAAPARAPRPAPASVVGHTRRPRRSAPSTPSVARRGHDRRHREARPAARPRPPPAPGCGRRGRARARSPSSRRRRAGTRAARAGRAALDALAQDGDEHARDLARLAFEPRRQHGAAAVPGAGASLAAASRLSAVAADDARGARAGRSGRPAWASPATRAARPGLEMAPHGRRAASSTPRSRSTRERVGVGRGVGRPSGPRRSWTRSSPTTSESTSVTTRAGAAARASPPPLRRDRCLRTVFSSWIAGAGAHQQRRHRRLVREADALGRARAAARRPRPRAAPAAGRRRPRPRASASTSFAARRPRSSGTGWPASSRRVRRQRGGPSSRCRRRGPSKGVEPSACSAAARHRAARPCRRRPRPARPRSSRWTAPATSSTRPRRRRCRAHQPRGVGRREAGRAGSRRRRGAGGPGSGVCFMRARLSSPGILDGGVPRRGAGLSDPGAGPACSAG